MVTVRIFKATSNAILPTRKSRNAVGYDLHSAYDYIVKPKDRMLIKTDLIMEIPESHYGRIVPRSTLALTNFIDIGGGVIDPDYRGIVGIIIFNFSNTDFIINRGDRIAQIIFEKVSIPTMIHCTNLNTLVNAEKNTSDYVSTKI